MVRKWLKKKSNHGRAIRNRVNYVTPSKFVRTAEIVES